MPRANQAPTEAQAAAMTRNFRIFRLRSLAVMVTMMRPQRAKACLSIIDEELVEFGADTTEAHQAKREQKPPRRPRGLRGW